MIKIGIVGYGNLGRGIECAIAQNKDMELVAIFTRRNPSEVNSLTNVKVCKVDDAINYKDKIDVMILCGGSANDLPDQTPYFAKYFNVVDSYDTHKKIPEHFANVDESARENNNIAIISVGWDPGMFSINRLYSEAIIPDGKSYTFWGYGVSQGHSDAIRRIDGVKDARQYTVPIDEALEVVRNGECPDFTTGEKHRRECYVVAEEGADKERIEREIKTMPNYFDEYETTVNFISEEELNKNHSKMPHGGIVIRNGKTGINLENTHTIEYKLNLESNPEFTSSVLLAFARGIHRMRNEGKTGCVTVFDVPPAYLSPKSAEELRKELL